MHSLTLDKHKNFLDDFVSLDKLVIIGYQGVLPFFSFAQRIKCMLM